ncbi:MAG: MBL fold metallo-hydrolase [Bacteroidetes bacterium]|jgi:glyoxylase-like metal-dependent hydrolase (beta-lactamase superfamily II)|nr:MBL fold metallo-hydrolase [Bacteroidota bacterium]MCA6442554.1 MBL fold metallo-hydrolase [Bacteroidota bacterium]
MKSLKLFAFILIINALTKVNAQNISIGSSWTVIKNKNVKVHTYMSPTAMFANTSHIIELKNELIIVDGQFFAPYALELKKFTDSIGKPVTRFYISHDHPDHFIGFGDAFPDVKVYALAETKTSIEQTGQGVLEQRQAQFGPLIATKLNKPSVIQQPGEETIGNVKFIFEKSLNNESTVSLVIKLPELGVYIAQDIVYNKIHLFIEGDTKGWETALNKIIKEKTYKTILAGHGKEGGEKLLKENLTYLAFVNETITKSKNKEEFKAAIIKKYPEYGGEQLVDIYLNYYLKPSNWIK